MRAVSPKINRATGKKGTNPGQVQVIPRILPSLSLQAISLTEGKGQLNTDVRGRTSASRHRGISGAAPAIARQM
ncbi:hypothetical protein N7520_006347 [Penicillium odoratum]|uniref:uncharacterized protein n=1 Tax=Penicillium odoratum TaxID=1167516 RepID=UPI002546B2AA|nr:uncharacterized protein N7520_006347 [Penicillium odoratum]KAJ5759191.1 hypothetical protein N7520_006347 [Penicillium odoratum]